MESEYRMRLWVLRGALLFFAVQTSGEALSYIFGDLCQFDALFQEKYTRHLLLVRTHGTFSVMALCLGLLTFSPLTFRLRAHAWMGRAYAAAVGIGGLTAIPMALMAEGGWSTRLAFLLQAALWLGTISLAVWAARTGRFRFHRRSMVRNYALTYSAVVSRLLLHGLQQAGLDFSDIYPLLSWTWLFALLTAEWWVATWRSDAPTR